MNPDVGSLTNYFIASQQALRQAKEVEQLLQDMLRDQCGLSPDDYRDVDFETALDWRLYVPSDIAELWNELSEDARQVAVIMAYHAAGQRMSR